MGGEFNPTNEVDIYNVDQQSWSMNANCVLPYAEGFLSGAVTKTNKFVVYGGAAPQPACEETYILEFSDF